MPEDFNSCSDPVLVDKTWVVTDVSTVNGKRVTEEKGFMTKADAENYVRERIAAVMRRKK